MLQAASAASLRRQSARCSSHWRGDDEDAAREWVRTRPYVSGAAFARIERLVETTLAESRRQNLIAPSTADTIWFRHVVDSLQLVEICGVDASWLDVGSGGGFPGLVLAMLDSLSITCVEPRRTRADYLQTLGAERPDCRVITDKVERVSGHSSDIITARAVAPPDRIVAMTIHLAHSQTRWALPSGRTAPAKLDQLRARWHGVFHVKQSITDPEAGIIVIDRLAGPRT